MCELIQIHGMWKNSKVVNFQCVRCFMYFETTTAVKQHINKHHMQEKKQQWTSGRFYNNEIIEDQTPYRFLRTNEFNPDRSNLGMQYLCLLGCPPSEEQNKMLLTGKDIREHYIVRHTFDELKMWGYNQELLKQEIGLNSNYMHTYANVDVNLTFRGLDSS